MCIKIFPLYNSLPIIPSKHVQIELLNLDLSLWDICDVLEFGYDCQMSRREENVIERCIEKDNKELRVVVAKVEMGEQDYWRLIHVSKTSR